MHLKTLLLDLKLVIIWAVRLYEVWEMLKLMFND
jgi:hypothetical protein